MNHFLKKYTIAIGVLFTLFCSPIIYLSRLGEFMNLDRIVNQQINNENTVLYGTAVHVNTMNYKRMLLRESNPKVIALGSSRVMQFRQNMFKVEFVNMGGGMNSISEGLILLPDIIAKAPALVILGIDVMMIIDIFAT